MQGLKRTYGKSRDSTGGRTVKGSWQLRTGRAAIRLAALFLGGARTTRRYPNGGRQRPKFLASSVSPWAAPSSGSRSLTGEPRRSRERKLLPRLPVAIGG